MYKLTREHVLAKLDELFSETAQGNNLADSQRSPRQLQELEQIVARVQALLDEFARQNQV